MRIGVVQLTSTDDLAANLATAERLVREAAAGGAEFVVVNLFARYFSPI